MGLKRPDGLTAMAVLWAINGVFFVVAGVLTASNFSVALNLSESDVVSGSIKNLLSEALVLNALLVFVGVLYVVGAYGFWVGKRFSYKLAFIVPILTVIITAIAAGLYLSAPSSSNITFAGPLTAAWVYLGIGIFWTAIYWLYVTKLRVKNYLKMTLSSQAAKSPVESVNREHVVVKQGKFYCRYCGTENPRDALFCESCGKQLR